MKGHGSDWRYRKGCRCGRCRAGNAMRVQAFRAARRARLGIDPTLARHGLFTTYCNWGCRCIPCSKAASKVKR